MPDAKVFGNWCAALREFKLMPGTDHSGKEIQPHNKLDGITGLPRRDIFAESLCKIQLSGGQTSVLCLLDLDNFGFLNMIAGTDAGNLALRQVASFLQNSLGLGDLLARTGDDEFSIVFANCAMAQAVEKTKTLQGMVANCPVQHLGEEYRLSASAGLVLMQSADEVSTWLAAAMAACAAAKETGRGRVVVAGQEQHVSAHQADGSADRDGPAVRNIRKSVATLRPENLQSRHRR